MIDPAEGEKSSLARTVPWDRADAAGQLNAELGT